MRIELPPASWAESGPRAEDDAHTLTLAAPAGREWVEWQWTTEPAAALRTLVDLSPRPAITLTL